MSEGRESQIELFENFKICNFQCREKSMMFVDFDTNLEFLVLRLNRSQLAPPISCLGVSSRRMG